MSDRELRIYAGRTELMEDIVVRIYWRESSVKLAAITFNATQPTKGPRFLAEWRRCWPFYRLTIRKVYERSGGLP
jgi:hypothetical protein